MIRNFYKLGIFNFGILIKSTDTELFKFGICQDIVQVPLQVKDKQFQLLVNEFNKIIAHPFYEQVTRIPKTPQRIIPLLYQSEEVTQQIIQQIDINNFDLTDISKFLIHFGILDLDLWKKFILKLITNINNSDYVSLNQQLSAVLKFMQKFRIISFRSHHIAFEERELNFIINNVQFMNEIIKLKYNQDYGTQHQYLKILIQLNQLVNKLGRASNIRYYDYNIFMNEQINNLQIELGLFNFQEILYLLSLLQSIHNMNQTLKDKVNKCLSNHLQNMKSINQAHIKQILKIWQIEGQYNEEILNIIKPHIYYDTDIIKLGYDLIAANIFDREIIKRLLQQNSYSLIIQSNIKYSTYHVFYRIIQIKFKDDKEIISILFNDKNQNIQQSNGFCAQNTFKKQLKTCKIDKYIENVDNNIKSQLEKQIVNQIISICQQKYSDRAQFYRDLKICQFIVDLGIIIDNTIKIAFELEGIVYSYQSVKSGKKKLKDIILKEDGWNIIQLQSSEMKAEQFIKDEFRTEIYGQIIQKIENIIEINSKL